MADNRLPSMADQHGGRLPMPQTSAFAPAPGVGMGMAAAGGQGQPMFMAARHPMGGQPQFVQGGVPFYPGMTAPVMGMPNMAPAMFPMQSARPPTGLPPPYTPHLAAGYQAKTRAGAGSSRQGGGPARQKTEKELYFEQQQKRLKQFGKPGAQVADADKLIENMFGKADKSGRPATTTTAPTPALGQSSGLQPVNATAPAPAATPGAGLDDEDDGFGDFLGGPTSGTACNPAAQNTVASTHSGVANSQTAACDVNTPTTTTTTTHQQQAAQLNQSGERKDLMSMMMECSDLSAPQKAKGFHKPSLLEVQKSGVGHTHRTPEYHESDHARRWNNTQELEGLFVVNTPASKQSTPAHPAPHPPYAATSTASSAAFPSHMEVVRPHTPPSSTQPGDTHAHVTGHVDKGTSLPGWCRDKGDNLPVVYKQVLEAVTDGDKIVIERLYPILLLSGLPRQRLGQLWNMANTHTPGELIRSELWMLLALIALVQNNYEVTSLAILRRCPQAPVPFLGQPPHPVNPGQPPHPVNPGQPPHTGQPSHPIAPGQPSHPIAPDQPSHPVNMGQTPHPANPSQPPQPLTSALGAPVPPSVYPASQTHPSQHPPQNPAAPAVIPGVTMTTAAAPLSTSSNAAAEDDFADFQAAPTPVAKNTTATRTDDSYGQFIGGANTAAKDQSIASIPQAAAEMLETMYRAYRLVPVVYSKRLTPRWFDCLCSYRAKAAAEKLETMYTEGMTIEDQYNSNVRNFFCSSDSSTGHTTPNSLDDDDFTDGHDSLSQVSTSEQSENEDIRAFENYVEEFNRKRDAQISNNSPLHCPFPHPNTSGRGGTLPLRAGAGGSAGNRGVRTASAKVDVTKIRVPVPKPASSGSAIPQLPPVTQSRDVHHLPPVVQSSATQGADGGDDEFADFKSATGPVGQQDKGAGDDFATFKTAKLPLGGAVKAETRDEVLIGEEDKYGALRSLTSKQPSLFEHRADENNSSDMKSGQPIGTGDEEEWADFSGPVTTTTDVAELSLNATASLGVSGMMGFPATDDDGGDWADFETAKDVMANSSSVVGGSNPGLFTTPLPSTFSSLVASPGSSLSSALGAGGRGGTAVSQTDNVSEVHTTSVFAASHNSAGFSSAAVSGTDVEGEEDEWADFATAQPGSGSDTPPTNVHSSGLVAGGGGVHSASHIGGGLSTVHSDDLTSDAVFTGGGFSSQEQATVVTVKKKNLGTSDIMGVFKVRDDPATLSSYELPKRVADHQKPGETMRPYPSDSRQRGGGGKDHRPPSDFDEDLGTCPPPLDSVGDDDDEHEYSRGYDLDDIVNQPVPVTVYSPFGFSQTAAGYSTSAFSAVSTMSKGGASGADVRSHSLSPDFGDTDSLSNRVASLREDAQSISSLDLPNSKMATDAQRDSDTGGTDSQSVSSMEFGAVEGTGGKTEGAAESKSVDSLDLRSEPLDTEDMDDEGGDRSNRQGRPPPPGMLGPGPILGDRYNIDGQVEGSDRYAHQWERCLASSCRLISGANNIFNTISSSIVCNEVLRSPQGSDYILGVVEIYRLVCRIMASLPTTGVSSPSIEQSLKDIDLAWNNLTAFLVGASLLPEQSTLNFTHAVLKSDSPIAQQKACGVCLLDVDSRPRNPGNSSGEDTPKLSYGGRQYHAPCANFWVNCVDSMLPALKLPELL